MFLCHGLIGHIWISIIHLWLIYYIPIYGLHVCDPAVACAAASLEEVLAYLHSVSLAQPLASDEASLFLWTFLQVLPRYGRGCPRELASVLGYAVSGAAPHSLDALRCGLRSAVEKRAGRRRVV